MEMIARGNRSWRAWLTPRGDWRPRHAILPADVCQKVLDIYSWAAAIVSLVCLAFVYARYPGKFTPETLFGLYTGFAVLQLIAAILRGLPFAVRYALLAICLSALALIVLMTTGPGPNMIFVVLMLVTSTALFYGTRAGILCTIGVFAAGGAVAWGWVSGLFPMTLSTAEAASVLNLHLASTWIRMLIVLAVFTIAAILLMGHLLRGLNDALKESKSALQDLASEQEKRARTMEALYSSQVKFAKVFRFSPDAITVSDFDTGRYIEVNDGFERLLGYAPGEMIGRIAEETGHWAVREDRERFLGLLREHGFVRDFQATGRRRDGEIRSFHISAETFEISGRKALIVSGRDITDQLRADQALRESEEKFAAAFQSSPVSVLISVMETGHVLDVNAAFLRIYGGTREQAIGRTVMELGLWSSPEQREAVLAALRAGRPVRNLKVEGRNLRGEPIVSLLSCAPFTLHGQQCILSTAQDVSEMERAEIQLRQSEERFRSLIEHASDIITELSRDGQIRYISPAVERVLGFVPVELIGQNVFGYVHPEDLEPARESFRKALLASHKPVGVEFRLRHSNGSWRRLNVIGRSIPEQSGERTIIANARDVTDSRVLEEQFRQAQKMEAIGQLSAGVAHDFNNVLTILKGNISMIEMDETVCPPVREYLTEMSYATDRAANLTRQLLTFSRRQTFQQRDFDLNVVVADTAKMLKRIVGEDVQMHLPLAAEPALMRGDMGMIEQVLLNLVVNARDAMPQGGELTIGTELPELDETAAALMPQGRPGQFICLKVGDNGSGISPEALPRIFEPFYTTKEAAKGTGLGLATVYGIVTQHLGWVNVESKLGHGTTFRVYLPRLPGGKPDAVAGAAAPAIARPARNETILLVEDDLAVRLVVGRVLLRLGHRLLEADNGTDALELWNKHRQEIRLLITDLVMPGEIGGRELARRLSADNPGLPVLFVSGYSSDIAGRQFPVKKGEAFLSKPFDVARLEHTVRGLLGP